MKPTRRSLLKGVGTVLLGSTTVPALQTDVASAMRGTRSSTGGVALAVDINENGSIRGRSDDVRVEAVGDPVAAEDDSDDVLHITSIPADGKTGRGKGKDEHEDRGKDRDTHKGPGKGHGKQKGHEDDDAELSGAVPTHDYGVSFVTVRNRDLTVADLAEYDGEDESDAGFAYDWLASEADVVGSGTDHEQVGVGPDEAWLILQDPDASLPGRVGNPMGKLVTGQFTAVFRTQYADEGTGEWNTRTVSDELRGEGRPPWRELSVRDREFEDVGPDLVDAYGDATVFGVGVGRGDPFWGPSILDTYYRDLRVAGERYELPVSGRRNGRGRGRGRRGR